MLAIEGMLTLVYDKLHISKIQIIEILLQLAGAQWGPAWAVEDLSFTPGWLNDKINFLILGGDVKKS